MADINQPLPHDRGGAEQVRRQDLLELRDRSISKAEMHRKRIAAILHLMREGIKQQKGSR